MWIFGRFSDYKLSPYGSLLLISVRKLFASAVEGYRHIYVILEVFIPLPFKTAASIKCSPAFWLIYGIFLLLITLTLKAKEIMTLPN